MTIQREIPGSAVILLHTHKRHDTWPHLVEKHSLAIWQDTHDMRIIGITAASISRGCALNPVSQFQIRKLVQVTIGVKSQVERRRLRGRRGCSGTLGHSRSSTRVYDL